MALAGQFRLKTQTGSKRGWTGHWAPVVVWWDVSLRGGDAGKPRWADSVLTAASASADPISCPGHPGESDLPPKAGGDAD